MKKGYKSSVFVVLMFALIGATFLLLFLGLNQADIANITNITAKILPTSENPSNLSYREIENKTLQDIFKSDTPPVQIRLYRARNGDNLWDMAKRHGLNWYTILSVNNLRNASDISLGQWLKIPDRNGIIHVVSKDEFLEDIALKYDIDIKKLIGANSISSFQQIKPGLELFIPEADITLKQGLELMASRGIIAKDSSEPFIFPIAGKRKISSRFGFRLHPIHKIHAFHRGIDIPCRYNSTVRAVRSGRVTFVGEMGGYGNLVVIQHQDGYISRYGHNSALLVRKGQYVRQGESIAKAGSTGLATGPHLHFEIWRRERPENPLRLIPR